MRCIPFLEHNEKKKDIFTIEFTLWIDHFLNIFPIQNRREPIEPILIQFPNICTALHSNWTLIHFYHNIFAHALQNTQIPSTS